jgi:hypothetical protein
MVLDVPQYARHLHVLLLKVAVSPFLIHILRFSVLFAAIVALIKFRRIHKAYYPFIFVIWLGAINEAVVNTYLMYQKQYNIINTVIYCLLESILLLSFFRNMKVLKSTYIFWLLMVAFVIVWIADVLIIHGFGNAFSSYFNIVYSFVLVLLSISGVNKTLFEEKKPFKSPSFLIYIAILVYFTYGILVEAFWLYGLGASSDFIAKVYFILSWINPICNLIYALAILWMRKRQAFTLQF